MRAQLTYKYWNAPWHVNVMEAHAPLGELILCALLSVVQALQLGALLPQRLVHLPLLVRGFCSLLLALPLGFCSGAEGAVMAARSVLQPL
jgi:hypothetical protein